MRRTLVITDLTQMPNGNRVCIAGIDENNYCVRPILKDSSGVPKSYLFINNELIIRPRAKTEFDLYDVETLPPHIEDQVFDPSSIVSRGFCSYSEWENVLQNTSFARVDDIYDGLVQEYRWVSPGANTRSLATLSKVTIEEVEISMWYRRLRYRLIFGDQSGKMYNLPVSDLAFRELCYKEIIRDSHSYLAVSNKLTELLINTERVYLRLGLARPWIKPGLDEPRCYLQITGIYSFPDYLEGKSFADFLT